MLSADFTINRKNNKIDLLRFGRNTRKSRKSAISFEIDYRIWIHGYGVKTCGQVTAHTSLAQDKQWQK